MDRRGRESNRPHRVRGHRVADRRSGARSRGERSSRRGGGGLISLDKSLIVQGVNFLALLLVLNFLLYKPLVAKMQERTAAIQKSLEEAQAARAEAARQQEENATRLPERLPGSGRDPRPGVEGSRRKSSASWSRARRRRPVASSRRRAPRPKPRSVARARSCAAKSPTWRWRWPRSWCGNHCATRTIAGSSTTPSPRSAPDSERGRPCRDRAKRSRSPTPRHSSSSRANGT